MKEVVSAPFFRFLSAFVTGILIEICFPNVIEPVYLLFFSFAVIYFLTYSFFRFSVKSARLYLGLIATLSLITLGLAITRIHSETLAANKLPFTDITAFQGIVDSEVEEKAKTFKCEFLITKVKTTQDWVDARSRILLFIFKDGESSMPSYGNNYIIKGSPQFIHKPLNPGEFNYNKYFASKGIYYQSFIAPSKLHLVKIGTPPFIKQTSFRLRNNVDSIFKKYIVSKREKDIAAALILGIKSSLDNEIKSAYSATGTMHILAVSGLHVGIIYGILLWSLGWLKRFKNGKVLQALLIIILLCLYGFFTGGSASVLRSVVMFSLLIVGQIIGRRPQSLNMLFLSAFILLCFNPFYILDIGFQLSYLAVFGIITLYPVLNDWLETNNKIIASIWSVTAMSLCAQLATFPISLLYFHQFPNYFLISNLLVIPASFLIMYMGLVFLLLSWWPLVAAFLGWLIEKSVYILNQSILFMEKLPYATVKGIWLSPFQILLLYAIIITLFVLLYRKRFYNALVLFALFSAFTITLLLQIKSEHNQKLFIVYQINKTSCIDFITGKEALQCVQTSSVAGITITNSRQNMGISKVNDLAASYSFNFVKCLIWNHLKLLVFDQNIVLQSFRHKVKVDYIILKDNAFTNLDYLSQNFEFNQIIVDGSNKPYIVNKLIKSASEKGINLHATAVNGAFIKHIM